MKALLISATKKLENPNDVYAPFQKIIEKSGSENSLDIVTIDDLVFSVGDNSFDIYYPKLGQDLSIYKVIFIRGKTLREYTDILHALSIYAELHSIPLINEYKHFIDHSKFTQAVQFYELGIPAAKTVYATRAVLEESVELPFPFPCILKATFAAHGNDNYLVHNIEEVRTIVGHSDKNFILQRFVPNDGDLRLLCIGRQMVVIGRKGQEGTHLNNTSQGGEAELIDSQHVPADITRAAFLYMDKNGMTIAGIDVLMDRESKEYYFLEVNAHPQLVSGAFVKEKEALFQQLLQYL